MKTENKVSRSKGASGDLVGVGRLFFLEASNGRVMSVNPDGSDRKVIATEGRVPDGLVIEAGHIYWTNMGNPKLNDGSIERVDLDGQNRITIVPQGSTITPERLHLDKKTGNTY